MPDPQKELTILETILETMLETPEQITLFRLLQVKYGLKIEIDTGMTHSQGSMLKAANRILTDAKLIETPYRYKRDALLKLDEHIETKKEALRNARLAEEKNTDKATGESTNKTTGMISDADPNPER